MSTVKISIITVTMNCESHIVSTIESVLQNSYPNIEYIIIDGGSIDRTNDLINLYNNHIAYYISEKDDGIFDAMNKGIKSATGDWLLFLNAGDILDPRLDFHQMNLGLKQDIALIYGNTFDIGICERTPFALHSLNYGIIMACHQSMLFNKKLLNERLNYDNSYRFYNDFELVARLYLAKFKFLYIDITFSHFLGNGFSSHIYWAARRDKIRMMIKLFGFIGLFKMVINKIGYKPYKK